MKAIATVLGSTALLLATACSTTPELQVRPATNGLSLTGTTAPAVLAEAKGQLAIGNTALAAGTFRRVLRLDQSNVDAMVGLAACYDRMGRFDVSRIYYEKALAAAPDDTRLYALLAGSLDLQGLRSEAAELRNELAGRQRGTTLQSAARAQNNLPVPVAPSGDVQAVASTVLLPPLSPPAAIRLERLSLAEVALVTTAPRERVPTAVAVPLRSLASVQPILAGPKQEGARLTLLNAARIAGLAARTRRQFTNLGWRQVVIGDAPRVLQRSEVRYSGSRAAEAQALGKRLGVPVRAFAFAGDRLVLHLGRDSAARLKIG